MKLNITGVTGSSMRRSTSRKKNENQSSFSNFMVVLSKAVLLCGAIVIVGYAYCAQNNEIVKVNQEIAQINKQCENAEREAKHLRNLCDRRRSRSHLDERIAHFGLKLVPASFSQRSQLRLLSPEQVARTVYRAPVASGSSSAATAYNDRDFQRRRTYSRY